MSERFTRTQTPDLDRRTVLRGIAVTGAAGASIPLLVSCGDDSSDDDSAAVVGGDRSGAGEGQDNQDQGGGQSDGGGGGGVAAPTGDIPVGGGKIFADQKVVVTQPNANEFAAFSAVCTHQGCTVTDVADGTINCACHGSKFAVEDGSVVQGPATSPLEEKRVSVQHDQVMVN